MNAESARTKDMLDGAVLNKSVQGHLALRCRGWFRFGQIRPSLDRCRAKAGRFRTKVGRCRAVVLHLDASARRTGACGCAALRPVRVSGSSGAASETGSGARPRGAAPRATHDKAGKRAPMARMAPAGQSAVGVLARQCDGGLPWNPVCRTHSPVVTGELAQRLLPPLARAARAAEVAPKSVETIPNSDGIGPKAGRSRATL